MVKGVHIKIDQSHPQVELETLQDYQEKVEGWIEPVTLKLNRFPSEANYQPNRGVISVGSMYVNEEYLFKFNAEQDFNRLATDVAGYLGNPHLLLQGILGPVVIVGPANDEGEDTDVTQTVLNVIDTVTQEEVID